MQRQWNWQKIMVGMVIFVICAGAAFGGLFLLYGWRSGSREVAKETTNEIGAGNEQIDDQADVESQDSEEVSKTNNPLLAPSKLGDPRCEYNFTTEWGSLMLINPNFPVSTDWIARRKQEMINIEEVYGIREGNPNNGVPLLDPEAAKHLSEMLADYKKAYPGHEMVTRSCFRSRGTNCGRLCFALGETDHHSGYTCDLIDPAYGTVLDTNTLSRHLEWQWLHSNSYKYGFIDRFPKEWAGGSMAEPVNIDANGTTGLYETWHYRYVVIANN